MEDDERDEEFLRILGGAYFGPASGLVLPSGRRLDPDEANALTSFYAPAVGEEPPGLLPEISFGFIPKGKLPTDEGPPASHEG